MIGLLMSPGLRFGKILCRKILCPCVLALGLSACLDVPELEDSVPKDLETKAYPPVLPLDHVLDRDSGTPQEEKAEVDQEIKDRLDALQERTATLSEPILDEESRDRLSQVPGARRGQPLLLPETE